MEPSYATIDESMSATLQGSEAAISNILVTQDLRELHKSEAGEKGPYSSRNEDWSAGGIFLPIRFQEGIPNEAWHESRRC